MKSVFPLSAVLFAGISVRAEEPQALKDVFKDAFRVGAAISTEQVMGGEPAALELTARQCNTITPENLLKWAEVHPDPNQYNFEPADRYVEWGEKHGMFIVGHTLVWHNQTPAWAFRGEGGKPHAQSAAAVSTSCQLGSRERVSRANVQRSETVSGDLGSPSMTAPALSRVTLI